MKLPLPRIIPLAAAAVMTMVSLGVTVQPVYAANGPDYRLTAAAPAQGTRVANETLWRCGDDGCRAAKATSRPAVVCAQAAREFGKLESFVFRGEAFDATALEKCNARAN